jgi:hypothetical protein
MRHYLHHHPADAPGIAFDRRLAITMNVGSHRTGISQERVALDGFPVTKEDIEYGFKEWLRNAQAMVPICHELSLDEHETEKGLTTFPHGNLQTAVNQHTI